MEETSGQLDGEVKSTLGKISQSVDYLLRNSVTDAKMATGIRQVHDSLDEKIFESGRSTRAKVENSKQSNNQKNNDIINKIGEIGKVFKSSDKEEGKTQIAATSKMSEISSAVAKSSVTANTAFSSVSSSISAISTMVDNKLTQNKDMLESATAQLNTVAGGSEERKKILTTLNDNKGFMDLNRKSLDANKQVLDKIKKHIGAIEELDDIKNEIKQDGSNREVQATKDKVAREALLHDVLTAIKDIKVEGGGKGGKGDGKDVEKEKQGVLGWLMGAFMLMLSPKKLIAKLLGKLFKGVIWPMMKKAASFFGGLLWKAVKGLSKMAWSVVKLVGKGMGKVLDKLTGGLFSKATGWLKGAGSKVAGWFTGAKNGVANFMKKASDWGKNIKGAFSNIMGKAGGWLTGVKDSAIGLMKNAGGWLKGLGSSAMGWLGDMASKGAGIVADIAKKGMDVAKNVGKTATDALKGGAKGGAKGAAKGAGAAAKGAGAAKKGAGVASKAEGFFGSIWGGIKSVASKGANLAKKAGGAIKKGAKFVAKGAMKVAKAAKNVVLKPIMKMVKSKGPKILSTVLKGGKSVPIIGPIISGLLAAYEVKTIMADASKKPEEKKKAVGALIGGKIGGALGGVLATLLGQSLNIVPGLGVVLGPAMFMGGSIIGEYLASQMMSIGGFDSIVGGLAGKIFGLDYGAQPEDESEEAKPEIPKDPAKAEIAKAPIPPKPVDTKATKVAGPEVAKAVKVAPPKPPVKKGKKGVVSFNKSKKITLKEFAKKAGMKPAGKDRWDWNGRIMSSRMIQRRVDAHNDSVVEPDVSEGDAPVKEVNPQVAKAAKVASVVGASAMESNPLPKGGEAPKAPASVGATAAAAATSGATTVSKPEEGAKGVVAKKAAKKGGFFSSVWGGIKKAAGYTPLGMAYKGIKSLTKGKGDEKGPTSIITKGFTTLMDALSKGFSSIASLIKGPEAKKEGEIAEGPKTAPGASLAFMKDAPGAQKVLDENRAKVATKTGMALGGEVVKKDAPSRLERLEKWLTGSKKKGPRTKSSTSIMHYEKKIKMLEQEIEREKSKNNLSKESEDVLKVKGKLPFMKDAPEAQKVLDENRAKTGKKQPGFFGRMWDKIKTGAKSVGSSLMKGKADEAKGKLGISDKDPSGWLSQVWAKVKKSGTKFLDTETGGMFSKGVSGVQKVMASNSPLSTAMDVGSNMLGGKETMKEGVKERASTATATATPTPGPSKADDLSEGIDGKVNAVGTIVGDMAQGSAMQFKSLGSKTAQILSKIEKSQNQSVYDVRLERGSGVSYI